VPPLSTSGRHAWRQLRSSMQQLNQAAAIRRRQVAQ